LLGIFAAGCGVTKQESKGGDDGGSPPAVVTPPDTPPPSNWNEGLTGIEITTNKTEYFIGEEIIVTVNGIYNAVTADPRDITEYVTDITGADTSAAGTITITARTGDFTASAVVLVKAAKVIELRISSPPDKTVYYAGADPELDLSGLAVVGVLDQDGQEINIAAESLQITGYDLTAAGPQNITVKYKNTDNSEVIAVFQIYVAGMTGMTVTPTKTKYALGEDFDPSTLSVTANYSDGSTKTITLSAVQINYSSYNKDTTGTYTITVTYGGFSKNFTVQVIAVTGMTVTPAKTKYLLGEDFDPSTLSIIVDYSDGSQDTLSLSQVNIDQGGYNKNAAGSYTIIVRYDVFTQTFTVTVFPPPALELTVNSGSDREFILPIHNNTTNDLWIDWGDGVNEHYTNSPVNDAGVPHTYPANGEYVIKLAGSSYFTGKYSSGNGGALGFSFAISGKFNKNKLRAVSGNLVALLGEHTPRSNAYMFYRTFADCQGLTGSIPSGLFSGIQGAPAEHMFDRTFYNCVWLTSIPSGLFSGIQGAPAEYMFYSTFEYCRGLTGSIPSDLFSGIEGAPASGMFHSTFSGCGLTSIPAGLLSGIQGAPTEHMFYYTFAGCSGLTSLPSDLFSGIQGTPTEGMFYATFYGCSGLRSIPSGLFSGIQGAPAPSMFAGTFENCSGLSSIPSDLFSEIQGASAEYVFADTFKNCSGLSSIPSDLFSGIKGAPASGMFYRTFEYCRGLTGSIPSDLFSGIQGAPASSMFYGTFSGCSGLTGSIPTDLFSGIQGPPASSMFHSTFSGCSGLTGSIPAGLFSGIQGASASSMFHSTFYNCSGLTGIGEPFVGYLYDNEVQEFTFYNTFANCVNLTGPSAKMKMGGDFFIYLYMALGLHEYSNVYYGATKLDDYESMRNGWK
jgi:hypothetical protein